jgi:beta-glucosidase
VIQVYVHAEDSQVPRPVKELKAFKRVFLHPGETREVPIDVKVSKLAYFDVKGHRWVLEPGKYDLLVGSSSRDLPMKGYLLIGR